MERSYMISFKISDQNTVNKVTDSIKILGKWWNHINNIWIVKTDLDIKTIKSYLNVYLSGKDQVIILTLDGEAEWIGIDNIAASWLTNYLIK